jgi:acetolactate synthase I/III small subunit
MKQVISVLVKNRPRVLARVAGLFARRGFNIDSLAVSTTEDPRISRMTISVDEDEATLEQVCKQLEKLHDVTRVIDHTHDTVVERELCLVKASVPANRRTEFITLVQVFRGDVVDVGNDTMMVQTTGKPDKVDAFVRLLSEFGVLEMVRTGKVVLARAEGRQEMSGSGD